MGTNKSDKTGVEIISVAEANWRELKAIRLASLKESPEAFSVSYESALNRSESEWRARASGVDGYKFFIATDGSQSVGIIGGCYTTGQYELISMWVSPSHRGMGIATSLIDRIIAHARTINQTSIVLTVSPDNISAYKLYEKHGFVLVAASNNSTNRVLNILQLNLNG